MCEECVKDEALEVTDGGVTLVEHWTANEPVSEDEGNEGNGLPRTMWGWGRAMIWGDVRRGERD